MSNIPPTDRQARSETLAIAAHKLRTPLVGILGFSELLLKREFDDEKRREVIETIFRQATSFKKILDNYMDLERLDATQGKDFHFEHTSLEPVLEQVMVEPTFAAHADRLSIVSPESWHLVNIDVERIKQVLTHVLTNAISYSAPGSNIICQTVVDTHADNKRFGVRVTDNGIGMAPNELQNVGERFYRVDDSSSVPGGGLGIALSRQIMTIHGGQLALDSTKNKGTVVTIWLPIL